MSLAGNTGRGLDQLRAQVTDSKDAKTERTTTVIDAGRVAELAGEHFTDAVDAVVDGDEVEAGDQVRFLNPEDDKGRAIYCHTTAHVLAQAMEMNFGDVATDINLGFWSSHGGRVLLRL